MKRRKTWLQGSDWRKGSGEERRVFPHLRGLAQRLARASGRGQTQIHGPLKLHGQSGECTPFWSGGHSPLCVFLFSQAQSVPHATPCQLITDHHFENNSYTQHSNSTLSCIYRILLTQAFI